MPWKQSSPSASAPSTSASPLSLVAGGTVAIYVLLHPRPEHRLPVSFGSRGPKIWLGTAARQSWRVVRVLGFQAFLFRKLNCPDAEIKAACELSLSSAG